MKKKTFFSFLLGIVACEAYHSATVRKYTKACIKKLKSKVKSYTTISIEDLEDDEEEAVSPEGSAQA